MLVILYWGSFCVITEIIRLIVLIVYYRKNKYGKVSRKDHVNDD